VISVTLKTDEYTLLQWKKIKLLQIKIPGLEGMKKGAVVKFQAISDFGRWR
jgi:hypothetical protein